MSPHPQKVAHQREGNRDGGNSGVLSCPDQLPHCLHIEKGRDRSSILEHIQIQEKFKAKVMGYRTAIIEIVDRIVDKFFEDCLITDGYIEILKEIQ